MSTGLRLFADDVDVTCHAYAPLEISWGRDHPGDSFEPRSCQVTFDAHAAPARGARLRVELNAPASSPTWADTPGTFDSLDPALTFDGSRVLLTVFVGVVTDTDTGWEPLVPHTSWAATRDVAASDPIVPLASLPVGSTPWPQETITARAARIEALTPLTWLNDPSALLVAARDVDSQPAADLLDDLAHTGSLSGGIWFDPATGYARFILDAMRDSPIPDIVLTSCQILADVRLVESVNDVTNDVTVTYLDPGNPDAAPEAHAVNAASVDEFGTQHRAISTELVTPADAQARATGAVTRFGISAARFTDVALGTRLESSREVAEALLVAGPGMRVRLTELPAPAPRQWDGYTEGWGLEVDAEDWTVTLKLSPAVWSGPLLTFDGADPSVSFDTVDPAQRWVDATTELWTDNTRDAGPTFADLGALTFDDLRNTGNEAGT